MEGVDACAKRPPRSPRTCKEGIGFFYYVYRTFRYFLLYMRSMDYARLSLFGEKRVGLRIVGSMMIQGFSLFLFIALYVYCRDLKGAGVESPESGVPLLLEEKKIVGIWGLYLARFLTLHAFGSSAFFLPLFLFAWSLKLLFPRFIAFGKVGGTILFMMVWTAIALGYFYPEGKSLQWYRLSGGMVSNFSLQLKTYMGHGVLIFLGFSLIAFLLLFLGGAYFSPKGDAVVMDAATPQGSQGGAVYRAAHQGDYTSFPHAELHSAYFSVPPPPEQKPPSPVYPAPPFQHEATPSAGEED